MSTAVVRNIGAAVLVLGALIIVFVVAGGGPSSTNSAPVSATAPTLTVTPTTVDPVAAISCPAGTMGRALPGPVPAQAAAGFRWSPAAYPTSGWCETPV